MPKRQSITPRRRVVRSAEDGRPAQAYGPYDHLRAADGGEAADFYGTPEWFEGRAVCEEWMASIREKWPKMAAGYREEAALYRCLAEGLRAGAFSFADFGDWFNIRAVTAPGWLKEHPKIRDWLEAR